MTEKTAILLDLDGTIIDASESITKTARLAMRQHGVEPPESDDMLHLIGPPFASTFRDYYNLDEETSWKVTETYRDMYGREGVYNCTLYDGVGDLIKGLKDQGKKVLLATSKPVVYARIILEHLKLLIYFDALGGPPMKGDFSKADAIRMAMKEAGVAGLNAAVQVGDRHYDINGAREVGIDSIGVLYGFGSKEELVNAGATLIVEDIPALGKALGVW